MMTVLAGADRRERPEEWVFGLGAGPMQVCFLPVGAGGFRRMPSGADTEVRPPATLDLLDVTGS